MAPSTMLHVDGPASQPSKFAPVKIVTHPGYSGAAAGLACPGSWAPAAQTTAPPTNAARTRAFIGVLSLVRVAAIPGDRLFARHVQFHPQLFHIAHHVPLAVEDLFAILLER